MTEERRTNGTWHMSKSLSVSHLFTYVTDIEQGTVVNSMDVKSLSERMDRTDARRSEQFSEIKEMLKDLTVKIDNLGSRRER